MCDIAAPAVLDRYASRFKERVDRFSDAWHLCVLADTRCRSELWESECRRQSQFDESNPEISAFVPSRPWNSVVRATSNDRDFWKEELEDLSREQVREQRQVQSKIVGVLVVHTRGSDGRYSTTATDLLRVEQGTRWVRCEVRYPIEPMYASFVWNHTEQLSAHRIQAGSPQPKVRGTLPKVSRRDH